MSLSGRGKEEGSEKLCTKEKSTLPPNPAKKGRIKTKPPLITTKA